MLIAADVADAVVATDHAFDAFVAALTARAATRTAGAVRPTADLFARHDLEAEPTLPELVMSEGWIVLPACSLDDLAADDN